MMRFPDLFFHPMSRPAGWSRNQTRGKAADCPLPRKTLTGDVTTFSQAARVRFNGKKSQISESAECASPPSLSITDLQSLSPEERQDVRRYCLDQIKEVYGFDYNPAWHADLDTLASPQPEESLYNKNKGGHFLVVRDGENKICGTAGLQRLQERRADFFQRFFPKSDPKDIGSVWRVYIQKAFQGKGLGKMLNNRLEEAASEQAYKTLYLHTDGKKAADFWQKQGYVVQAEDRDHRQVVTTWHMKKDLPAQNPNHLSAESAVISPPIKKIREE